MRNQPNNQSYGTVFLVGAGPGDPELLTLKAMKAISQADCVLYDALISEEILELIPQQCTRIHVGKRCGEHKMGQADIQTLLVSCAKKYQRVVRLKGGDPFIFGRGGEELQYLQQRGIPTEIVPGISAAVGCAAAAQIPLTHRHLGNALLMQSGHSQYGDFELADNPTRVFYMGRKHAGAISANLLNQGLDEHTPVALIVNGTLKDQQVFNGTLIELPDMAKQHSGNGPMMMIVGEVASFALASTQSAHLSHQHSNHHQDKQSSQRQQRVA